MEIQQYQGYPNIDYDKFKDNKNGAIVCIFGGVVALAIFAIKNLN